MQQDDEEESAEEERQEPAEPAEEAPEDVVSTELKDPASMTPYGCPPGLPKMLGMVHQGGIKPGPSHTEVS